MGNLNRVILIGHLGADPECRYTGNGTAVVNFRIATTEVWKDSNGESQQRTEWHRIVVWGRRAEVCHEYLRKGRCVSVEGRLQTREWTDRDDIKRYVTEIIANDVQFLGSKPQSKNSASATYDSPSTYTTARPTSGGYTTPSSYLPPLPNGRDTDIPF